MTTHPPPEGRIAAVRSLFAGWAPSGRKLPPPEPPPPAQDPEVEPAPATAGEPAPATAGEPAAATSAEAGPPAVAPSVTDIVQPDADADTDTAAPEGAEPAHGDPEPAHDHAEPAHGESKAVREDAGSARGDVEIGHDDGEPVHGDSQPVHGDSQPAREDPEPARDDVERAREDAEPAGDDVEPAREDAEPARDDPEPARDGAERARDDAGPAAGSPGPAGPAAAARPVTDADDSRRPVSARVVPRPQEIGEWRGIVLITGTDTDVGKTIVTSAIAAAAQAAGLRVAVVKPGQTGTADGGPTDADLVNRLAGPHTVRTLASYPDPLAPLAAARVAALPPLELYEVVDAVRAEAESHDLVLVEGAGGLLVPMGVRPSGDPWTFADLAVTLGVGTIVVTRAGLGTLNHTALTLEALARRGVPAGVVLGAWPAEPELVHWANLSELVPHLVGALPDGAGAMDPGVFRRSAPGWLTPALYGVVDNWRTWAEDVS